MDPYESFWADSRAQLKAETLADRYVVRRIGNSPEICEQLLALILSGEKTGTFSLPRELDEAGTMPVPGDHVILVHFDGRPACLVRMDRVETVPFAEIDDQHVDCEGPAARDLAVWRRIHQAYWTPMLADWGEEFCNDLPVVYQRFTLLYPG